MTPDAERIAMHLTDAEREAVAEWCRRSHVPLASWPSQDALRGFVDLAVLRAVDAALEAGRARSWTAALRLVGGEFRIPPGTLRKRFGRRRARQKEMGRDVPHAPTPGG